MRAALFDGWEGVMRVLVVGTIAYVALIVLLRVRGKRTLSKMNAFDLVVTVALGSALATTILSKSTALAEGVAALVLLVLLQYVATWCAARSEVFQAVIKAQPTLLMHRGKFLRGAMLAERVTEEEVLAAIRNSGSRGLGERLSVVLETDGSLSVIMGEAQNTSRSSLDHVAGPH